MARKVEVNKVGLRATSGKRVLAFGLVRVGVGMSPLMEAEKRIGANLVCPDHKEKVNRKWECGHGHEVDNRDVVKMYPYGGGMVELMDGEVPYALGTDEIDLIANVPEADVPAEYVEKSYLIWPDTGQEDSYKLVTAYLRDNGRAFIGTTTDAGTTKGFAVRYSTVTETLVAQLLSYEANVRWASVEQVQSFMAGVDEPAQEMIDMADAAFGQLPESFNWSSITDEYGEALAQAIATKAAGGQIVQVAAAAPAPTVDLMAALKASVEGGKTAEKKKALGTHGRTSAQVAAEKKKAKA